VGVLLGVVVAVCYGTADFLGGVGSRRVPVPAVLVVGQATGLVLLTVVALVVGGNEVHAHDLVRGAVGGLAGVVGLGLFFRGLAGSAMAVVAPIAAVGSAVVPFVWAVVAGGERPGALAVLGVAVAIVGVALVARPAGVTATAVRPVDLLQAAAAGLAFGVIFVLLGDTDASSGLLPVIASRVVSLPLAVLWFAWHLRRHGWHPAPRALPRSTAGVLLGQGCFDSSANAVFLVAAREGLLSEVSVVSALYPATTVVLASVVLGERVGPLQRAGLFLVLGGVILIAS
jgi:drug/metabolite transporter (DMT)-like permease